MIELVVAGLLIVSIGVAARLEGYPINRTLHKIARVQFGKRLGASMVDVTTLAFVLVGVIIIVVGISSG